MGYVKFSMKTRVSGVENFNSGTWIWMATKDS